MVLILKVCYCMVCSGNGWQGVVLVEVVGIIVILFVFLYFLFYYVVDQLVEGYVWFYEFVGDYFEVVEIFQVID